MYSMVISTPSRTSPWWKRLLFLLLQIIVFVLLGSAVGVLLGLVIEFLLPASWFSDEVGGLIVDWTVALVSALTAAFVIDYAQERYGWQGLGFGTQKLGAGVRLGAAVGGGIILLCFLILLLGGWVEVTAVDWRPTRFLGWLVFFLVQPLAEEVIMRSFLQNQIHRYFGAWPGLIACALVFGLLHAGNDNFTPLAGLQIFLGGLLMGQLFLYYGNIWAPYAMHAVWNFLQSTVLGFAVSGLDIYTLLQLKIDGPAWLTGGAFGIEGSLLSVLLILAANVYFMATARNEAPWTQEEIQHLPSENIPPDASDPV